MTPNSIDALLEALKRNESSSKDGLDLSSGGDDAGAADSSDLGDLSDTTADPDQDQDDDQDDQHNAAVVAMLQSDYPTIYAKISKAVGSGDDQGDPSDAMSAMGELMGSK